MSEGLSLMPGSQTLKSLLLRQTCAYYYYIIGAYNTRAAAVTLKPIKVIGFDKHLPARSKAAT